MSAFFEFILTFLLEFITEILFAFACVVPGAFLLSALSGFKISYSEQLQRNRTKAGFLGLLLWIGLIVFAVVVKSTTWA